MMVQALKLLLLVMTVVTLGLGAVVSAVPCPTECAGSIVTDLDSACTASPAYGAAGEISTRFGQLKLKACFQCPGSGEIRLSTYPYVTCNGKPLCGDITQPIPFKLSPEAIKCIYQNPNSANTCVQTSSCEDSSSPTNSSVTQAPTVLPSNTSTVFPVPTNATANSTSGGNSTADSDEETPAPTPEPTTLEPEPTPDNSANDSPTSAIAPKPTSSGSSPGNSMGMNLAAVWISFLLAALVGAALSRV